MKKLFRAMIVPTLLALTGCASTGDLLGLGDTATRVLEAATDENTSAKGITTGMSSSDAANVLMTRDYYGAIKAVHGKGQAQQPILEIESRDGKPIVIDAKSVRVYAPQGGAAQLAIAPPKEVESAGIKWFREVRRGLAEVFVPWTILRENSDTERLRIVTNGNVRQTELGIMGTAVTGSQDLAGQAIETYKPTIVTVPAAVTPAAATPAE
jgi:hypothetical protein